jgi:hypothetical protein
MDGPVVVVRAEGRAASPNMGVYQMRKGGNMPFWDGRTNGVSRGVVALVVPRTSHATEVRMVCVSNVIYQNVYLIRLINVSAFLSN